MAAGRCYELAWRWLSRSREGTLVHGSLFAGEPRRRIDHAWVEFTDEVGGPLVYEPSSEALLKRSTFYLRFKAKPAQKYTWEEAAKLALMTKHYGPW